MTLDLFCYIANFVLIFGLLCFVIHELINELIAGVLLSYRFSFLVLGVGILACFALYGLFV